MMNIKRGRGRPRKISVDNDIDRNKNSFLSSIPRKPRTKKKITKVVSKVLSCSHLSCNYAYLWSSNTSKICKLKENDEESLIHMTPFDYYSCSSSYQTDFPPTISMINIPGPIPNLVERSMDANTLNGLFEDIPDFETL